jgi:hypothetical protein
MSTDELDRLFADIPDPVRDGGARSPPAMEPPAEAAPTRAESAQRRWIAVALGAVWAVAFVFVLGVRTDVLGGKVLVQIIAWTLALPLGLSLALRPREGGWPAGVAAQRAGLIALLAVFIGLSLIPIEGMEAPLSFRTVRGCASFALLIGLPSLLCATFVLKRSFLNAPALRGAVVGAVCGMAGAVGIHTHCPVVTTSHVLLAHGLPIVVFAALGALFGARRGRV